MIIKSMLDTDLYKITMMAAVLELFPNAKVSYRFKNRGQQRFNASFLKRLEQEIALMSTLSLTDEEYVWMKEKLPFLKPSFLEYFKNYRYSPDEVKVSLDEKNDLVVEIQGYWRNTIPWEVPLMAIISELFFETIDTDWNSEGQIEKARQKSFELSHKECVFADFGTRRRRSYDVHDAVMQGLTTVHTNGISTIKNTMVGTSNVHFAMKYNLKPIGTFAHEWIMGNSVLEGLRNANYFSMQNWKRVYCASLGIALTDTYGSESFFKNFTLELASVYNGVRHDSGDALEFADKVVAHYEKLGIDPMAKTIVFSDGLNVDKALEIAEYCRGKIKFSFGIGTHFSNNGFEDSPALNMVIKLWSVSSGGQDVPVVKLSDTPGKVMGDESAVKVAKWTFFGEPLD